MDRNKTEQEKQIERNDKLNELIEWMQKEVDSPTTVTRAWVLLDIIDKAKELQSSYPEIPDSSSKPVTNVHAMECREMQTVTDKTGDNDGDIQQVKWAVVDKLDIYDSKEDAQECRELYHKQDGDWTDFVTVKIIEP